MQMSYESSSESARQQNDDILGQSNDIINVNARKRPRRLQNQEITAITDVGVSDSPFSGNLNAK